jgi:predicted dehydrogenase
VVTPPLPSGKILVIGAGSIGRRHAGNLAALGAEAELLPWRSFDATATAARGDVAGIVIATETPIRLDLIRLAAEKNWPFYAEKPLAWHPDQVAAIHAAAAPVAARSMIGFMMRYHPVLRALAALDLSGVFRFHAEIGHDVRQWRANWRFADSYAAKPEGGGVLLDLCHELDLMQALLPGLALCDARSLGHATFPGVDFATHLHLTAPNGAAGSVAMDYLSPVFIRRLTLTGTAGRVEADFQAARLIQHSATGTTEQSFSFERNDMFLAATRDFLALAAGADLPADPLRPRFDQMRATNDLIAAAWQARRFTGQIAQDMG